MMHMLACGSRIAFAIASVNAFSKVRILKFATAKIEIIWIEHRVRY